MYILYQELLGILKYKSTSKLTLRVSFLRIVSLFIAINTTRFCHKFWFQVTKHLAEYLKIWNIEHWNTLKYWIWNIVKCISVEQYRLERKRKYTVSTARNSGYYSILFPNFKILLLKNKTQRHLLFFNEVSRTEKQIIYWLSWNTEQSGFDIFNKTYN